MGINSDRIATSGYSRRINGTYSAHCKLQLIEQEALTSPVGQAFQAIVSAVTADLGGADQLSEMEKHLIATFAGAAILQGRQLSKILAGEAINPHEFASVALAMLRSRVGSWVSSRRAKSVTPALQHLSTNRR